MPTPHGIPIIDGAAFAEFVSAIGTDDARAAIELFAGEIEGRVAAILAAVPDNASIAARQAHAVAGGAATFALPALEAAARRVEREALAGGCFGAAATAVVEAAGPAISALKGAITDVREVSR